MIIVSDNIKVCNVFTSTVLSAPRSDEARSTLLNTTVSRGKVELRRYLRLKIEVTAAGDMNYYQTKHRQIRTQM